MNKPLTSLLPLLCAAVFSLLATGAHSSHNDPAAAAALEELEANRRLIVAENMPMAATRPAFWEVYDAYRAEIARLESQSFALLREFRDHFEDLTDARANDLLVSYLDLEQRALAVRSAYVAKFNAVIGPQKTLRFYQVENKLDSIIQSDIASVTPLVPDPPQP